MTVHAFKPAEPEPSFRQPPHNLDAEQAILGALLFDNGQLERCDSLVEADFFDPLHASIFAAIRDAVGRGRRADPITLKSTFAGYEPISPELTVPQYLGRLVAGVPTLTGVAGYAQTVRDLAWKRRALLLGEELIGMATTDAEPSAITEFAERALYEMTPRAANERATVMLDDAIDEALAIADRAYQRGGGLAGLSTGIPELDATIGGLGASDLLILAGRPGMGKTALATNIASSVAGAGIPVGFMSLEMSAAQLGARRLAEHTGIPASSMRTGRITADDMRRLMEGARALKGTPLVIEQSGGLTLAQIARNARRMRRKHKIELLVIDYLQLIAGSGQRGANRTQELTEITTGLKALAKELQIPILALSQLNREVEKREDKRPHLADLRESGSIEQDADVVMFVFREEYYVEREKPDPSDESKLMPWEDRMRAVHGKAEVIIGKHRHGPIGTVHLAFDAETTTFRSPNQWRPS
jgi:replicative DNA helicase